MARFTIVITGLIIISGLHFWLRDGVDQEQIQYIPADALEPDYMVERNSARISPLQRAVSIGHMAISSSNDDRIIFRTDTLHISGMNPKVIFRENIIFSKVKTDAFTIDWDTSLLSGVEESGAYASVRKLEIQSLDLTNGIIIVRKEGGESKRINTLNLKAVTYLLNHSELNTELNFTLDDGPFYMTGSGNLQPFDLKEPNSIFMDISGIEAVSEFVRELDFYFEMMDDISSGRMQFVYENLQMEIIDKDDDHVSFTSFTKSIITNKVVPGSENSADSTNEKRAGNIDYVRNPESSYFQHLGTF